MSEAMDKALMAMSLEEIDVPFDMPDNPDFRSCEKNALSIIGRLLNPSMQKMSSMILEMPRKWQKYERVRGVALSRERFQFIFKYEHDLVEILEKGLHSYNEWAMAIDRWVENPPPDYLQKVLLWVQIRNILVNYYTEATITALGELVGEVKVVAFDPDKPQSQDCVRVQILFDVSKPLRKKKLVNLPNGEGQTEVNYFYERVQRRCYCCQRMTHDVSVCPLVVKKKQEIATEHKDGTSASHSGAGPVLKPLDPLFGVLEESQVDLHPSLGRPKIAADVLEGMRQYLLVADGEERKIREERVKRSVKEAENDPVAQKTVLRLEAPVIVTRDLNKGKGLVFGYDTSEASSDMCSSRPASEKLMSVAIRAGQDRTIKESNKQAGLVFDRLQYDSTSDSRQHMVPYGSSSASENVSLSAENSLSMNYNSMANRVEPSLAGSSGVIRKARKPKKRPYVSERGRKAVGM